MSNGPYIVDETCLVFAKNIEEENERLRKENEQLRDAYDTDALTISYNLGYTCGKDIAKDEIERLRAENERLRKALTAILNDAGYHNPMRMTTEISDKILEDAAGALHEKIL